MLNKCMDLIMMLSLVFFSMPNSLARAEEAVLPDAPVIRITAVGDIMLGTDYPIPKLPAKNGTFLFESSKESLKETDIVFGNLEGPFCEKGFPLKKIRENEVYAFRMPPRLAGNLADAGFNVLSLANNHAFDFGDRGASSTRKVLDAAGIQYSGREGEVAEFEIHGIRIALIAFNTNPGPRSIVTPAQALDEIEVLSKNYDLVILSVHAGAEGRKALHIKNGPEYYLGEPRGDLIQFAHKAIERGADLVLGHGPHVPRAMEIYRGRLIAYSLGNFCTYEEMNLEKESGYAPVLRVELNKNGEFVGGKILSFIQFPPGGPKRDAEGRAWALIEKLSQSDFPLTHPLFITPDTILPNKQ